MQNKPDSFLAWICPLLKQFKIHENETIFYEGDEASCIYFLKEGSCGFVLPKHSNF